MLKLITPIGTFTGKDVFHLYNNLPSGMLPFSVLVNAFGCGVTEAHF